MTLRRLDEAVLTLVQRYVARQVLVLWALSELRPDLVPTFRPGGQRAPRPSPEAVRAAAMGRWGMALEWVYFIHGAGCRLVQVNTGEPGEWNAPELRRFDPNWLVNWMQWWLGVNGGEDEAAVAIKEYLRQSADEALPAFVFAALERLWAGGWLRRYPASTQLYGVI